MCLVSTNTEPTATNLCWAEVRGSALINAVWSLLVRVLAGGQLIVVLSSLHLK